MQNDLTGLYARKKIELEEGQKIVAHDNLQKKQFEENRKKKKKLDQSQYTKDLNS